MSVFAAETFGNNMAKLATGYSNVFIRNIPQNWQEIIPKHTWHFKFVCKLFGMLLIGFKSPWALELKTITNWRVYFCSAFVIAVICKNEFLLCLDFAKCQMEKTSSLF